MGRPRHHGIHLRLVALRCGLGTEAEGGIGDKEHVLLVGRRDRGRSRHAGAQLHLLVVDLKIGRVGQHVLRRRGAVGNLGQFSGEAAVRIGAHRKVGLLPLLDDADVGLVDGHLELKLTQIGGERQQLDRLQACRHRIAGLDRTGEHHAVDGRLDVGLGEIVLSRLERGHGVGDVRIGHGDRRARRVDGRGLRLKLGLARHGALGETIELLHALELELRLPQARRTLPAAGLRASQRSPVLKHLRLQIALVKHDEALALLDLVVDVDVYLAHDARKLGTERDGAHRCERAVRGHADVHVPALDGLGHVLDGVGVLRALIPVPSACHERGQNSARRPEDIARAAFILEQKLRAVVVFLFGHLALSCAFQAPPRAR